jgi:hypothetical protein
MIEFDPQSLAFMKKNHGQLTAKLTCTLLAEKQVLVLNHIFINPAADQPSNQLSLALVQAAIEYAQTKHLHLWPLGPAAIAACNRIPAAQALWYHKPLK